MVAYKVQYVFNIMAITARNGRKLNKRFMAADPLKLAAPPPVLCSWAKNRTFHQVYFLRPKWMVFKDIGLETKGMQVVAAKIVIFVVDFSYYKTLSRLWAYGIT